jgi:hypothetical protein
MEDLLSLVGIPILDEMISDEDVGLALAELDEAEKLMLHRQASKFGISIKGFIAFVVLKDVTKHTNIGVTPIRAEC